ncbi:MULTISPECIES: EpsG family protein [Enterococcus]
MSINNKKENTKENFLKKFSLTSLIPILIMWAIFSFNTDNVDMDTYKYLYYILPSLPLKETVGLEFGFVIIIRIFNYLSLNFQFFNFFIGSFCIVLLVRFVNLVSNNKFLVYILYFIFPFFLDVVQTRNTIAYLIVLNSLKFLLEKKHLKFIFSVVLASFFHVSALFFLIFLLVNYKKTNILTLFFIPVPLVLILFKEIISKLLLFLPNGYKYVVYLQGTSMSIVFIVYILLVINYIASIFVSQNNLILNKKYNYLDKFQIYFIKKIPIFNLLLILSVVLVSLDVDFFRIVRNMMILNYVNLSFTIYKGKLLKSSSMFFSIIQFTIIIIFAYLFLYTNQIDTVILRILNNNIIF